MKVLIISVLMMLLLISCKLINNVQGEGGVVKGYYKIVSQSLDNSIKTGYAVIEGNSIDKLTNEPSRYAIVFIKNTDYHSRCDSVGNFRLTVPSGTYKISIAQAGTTSLITKNIQLKSQIKSVIQFELGTTYINDK